MWLVLPQQKSMNGRLDMAMVADRTVSPIPPIAVAEQFTPHRRPRVNVLAEPERVPAGFVHGCKHVMAELSHC